MRASLLLVVALLALGAAIVHADVYMHHPRGSNDRLNEGGPGRNNGARLFDSQNNNRGGYNVGSVQRIYYYEGSVVPIEWTQQHSCGNQNGNNCELILQYTCGDKWVRDGQTTNTIPTDVTKCTNGNCDADVQFGRHESLASYMACRYRARNSGLFVSNQNVRGLSARHTRQNKNGNRNGYECPEERDYYPYWHPTIWRDAAIITNRPERCAAYKAQSQNVAGRAFCQWDESDPIIAKQIADNREGWVPITEEACVNNPKFPGGKWIQVPAFGIPEPDCVEAPFTRDNHLGNAVPAANAGFTNGFTAQYNWTVPAGFDSAYCVLRLRYNISTGDFPSQGFLSHTELGAGIDHTSNMIHLNPRQPDNNARYPSEFPIWSQYGMSRGENNGSFTARVRDDNPDDDEENGIRKAQPPSRDYTLRNNPQVDLFGPLLPGRVSADVNLNGQPLIRTRLAINTAQYGRTFQDRSHSFEIRRRPASLQGVKIHNLSVRGKKGNIVQTYPGVEYDFTADRLHVSQGDMVHIQWTGSSPQGGEGTGNNGDRSNLLLMRGRRYAEGGQELNPSPHIGQWGGSYPALINDTTQPRFMGLDFTRLRMLALNGLSSSHFDIGPLQATVPGEYRYMCSRNNAFSNRSQKGLLIVSPNPDWVAKGAAGIVTPPQPVSVTGTTQTASGRAWLRVAQNDGSIVIPGSVTVDDDTTAGTAASAPGGADLAAHSGSDWFQVRPATPLGVEEGQLWFEAHRPMPSNFFYKGAVYYKTNLDDEPQQVSVDQGFYGEYNRVALTQGGWYQSTSVPNTPLIAGLSVGLVGLVALCVYAYWRVRVQPVGGWKLFCAKGKGGAYAQGDSAELVSPGAASSSSPRV